MHAASNAPSNTPGNAQRIAPGIDTPSRGRSLSSARRASRSGMPHPVLIGRPILLAALGLLLAASPALGQFSGPALTSPSTDRGVAVPTSPADLLKVQHGSLRLQSGDLIAIHLFGSADYEPIVRVSLDGTIQLPLIGLLQVKGLTIDEAENLVAQRLKSSGMYRDPQVTININESTAQVVTISGEAHAVIPVTGERRLLELLSLAGGLPVTASHTITIDRPGVAKPIVVDLGTDPMHSDQGNIPIYPGDTIIVSRVGVVYLLGEFKNSGAIPIQQNSPLTLLEAAALGGGVNFDGRYKDLRIIRTINNHRTLVRVDIKQVMLGHAPDPVLQADDILFLPTNAMKAAISSGGPGVLLELASVMLIAIYH